MATKENYSEATVARLIELYNEKGTPGVAEIAAELGKTPKSIVAKLTHMKVYVKPEVKAAAPKDEGPTKKELLADLRKVVSWDVDGLNGANKESIANILAMAREAAEVMADEAKAA